MSSSYAYAHLSDLDPELAAYLEQHPFTPLPLPDDIAAAQRGWIEHRQPLIEAIEKARVRPDAKYRTRDYKVPVEGGEIIVRAVIPGTEDERRTYPFLFWTHGGVTTLNVDYRPAPGHPFPVQLNDSYAALKWAIANTAALSISPKEKGFILGGCSAGATLAAGLAIRARDDPLLHDTPVTGQYLSCPLLVHVDAHSRCAYRFCKTHHKPDNRIKTTGASPTDSEYSPVLATLHANLPPAFFQICGLDPLRDDGFLYARLLKEAGVKTDTKVYPGLPHSFMWGCPQLKASEQFQSDVRTGLRSLLTQGGFL
ncbi:Alpha/Beta hydrolase protein [Russula compacta]|nr:Alpha/Beta hydrolase protein [Russula compacta]